MSTQTEHLGLHQWEPNDPFLREEFNEDFRKIDEGVRLLRLVAMVTEEETSEIEIDLSHIDLTKFLRLDIRLIPGPEETGNVKLYFNEVRGEKKYAGTASYITQNFSDRNCFATISPSSHCFVTIFNGGSTLSGEIRDLGERMFPTWVYVSSDQGVRFENLTVMTLSRSSGTIAKGYQVLIDGLLK